MKLAFTTIVLFLGMVSCIYGQDSYGIIKYYDWDIKIDYQKKKLFAVNELTILNDTDCEITSFPFILYRLLEVNSVSIDGISVPFHQEIKSFRDFDIFQVNTIAVKPANPVLSGDSIKIRIDYEGTLLGYAETGLSYIKDRIDPAFTIIRPDCLPYPVLGKPQFSTLKSIHTQSFHYQLKAGVPDSLFVVNGGLLVEQNTVDNYTTFTYKSLKQTSQIVAAIADYQKLTTGKVATYYFRKDSVQAKKVHGVLLRTAELYTEWWGPLRSQNRFSLIEIPENYGSQATESYIIQTASAFNSQNQLRQLYHEVSHLWNVKATDKYPSRWNEGLATFIEFLAIEKLEGRNVLYDEVEHFFMIVKSDAKYGEVAFIDFGKDSVTDRSYPVGFIFFYLLYEILGEEVFNETIKSFYQEYYLSGATTDDFVRHTQSITDKNLDQLFTDWIYTTNYHDNMKTVTSVAELVKRYSD